jgi:hypothetical protein
MNQSHLLLLCFLLILAAAIAFFPLHTALAESDCLEWTAPQCDNGNLLDGYWGFDGLWVPAMITQQTHFTSAPPHTSGYAVYYAPGVMKATANFVGYDLTGFLGGVAMMSCSDLGQIVWIRRTNEIWEGPYLVVDCAQWNHHWSIAINRDEVVEVGYKTAARWGIIEDWKTEVEVIKSRWRPPEDLGEAIDYSEWFLEIAQYYPAGMIGLPARYIFRQPAEWYVEGRWISYLQFDIDSLYTEPWIRDIIYRTGTGD